MKYRGHPSAKGHAPNCPKCGSWLESTETCGAPVWDKTGRVFIASAIIGLGLSIAFGLPAGLITGALCFAAINLIFRHLNHLGGVFVAGPTSKIVKSKVSRHKPNYAIKPTPELAFRSRRTFRPARLIAALGPHMNQVAVRLALGLIAMAGSVEASTPLGTCENQLKPLEVVQPRRAPQDRQVTDSIREGEVVVSFVVSTAGLVEGQKLVATRWTRRGKASDGPKGYDQVVLEAIGLWKYPERAVSCTHQVTLQFKISER